LSKPISPGVPRSRRKAQATKQQGNKATSSNRATSNNKATTQQATTKQQRNKQQRPAVPAFVVGRRAGTAHLAPRRRANEQ
jgi:ribosomal protein L39E